MRESVDYRTAAPPKPLVSVFSASPSGEKALVVLALFLGALVGLAFLRAPSLAVSPLAIVPVMCGLFAFYGRATAKVEMLPRSGEFELVTRGFLSRPTRRLIRTGDVAKVVLLPVRAGRLALEPMGLLGIELMNGRIEHVFGRPIGVPPELGRKLQRDLEKLIDLARTEPPLVVRVADQGDGGLDAALGGSRSPLEERSDGDEDTDALRHEPSRRTLRRGRRPR